MVDDISLIRVELAERATDASPSCMVPRYEDTGSTEIVPHSFDAHVIETAVIFMTIGARVIFPSGAVPAQAWSFRKCVTTSASTRGAETQILGGSPVFFDLDLVGDRDDLKNGA